MSESSTIPVQDNDYILSNIVPPRVPLGESRPAVTDETVFRVPLPTTKTAPEAVNEHKPHCLPQFRDPRTCVWTATHAGKLDNWRGIIF